MTTHHTKNMHIYAWHVLKNSFSDVLMLGLRWDHGSEYFTLLLAAHVGLNERWVFWFCLCTDQTSSVITIKQRAIGWFELFYLQYLNIISAQVHLVWLSKVPVFNQHFVCKNTDCRCIISPNAYIKCPGPRNISMTFASFQEWTLQAWFSGHRPCPVPELKTKKNKINTNA